MTSTDQPRESAGDGDSENRRRGRHPLAVGAVAAAVLIVAGGGAYFATAASGDGEAKAAHHPPKLALDGYPVPTAATGPAPSAPEGIAPGEPDPGRVTYRAAGKLPAGPENARVYRAGSGVTAAEVTRLATALGVSGTPQPDGTAWKVGADKDGSGPLLRVERQAPGSWTFARYAPSPGGDNCLKGKACPSGGGGGSVGGAAGGVEGGGPVSEDAAKKAAAPVLKAVGQGDARLDARQLMGAVRVVNANPLVGGAPTYGWSTGLQIAADGTVSGGSGQLSVPARGDSYPVISAAEALKQLNSTASGAGRGGVGGCATPEPLTGAEKPAAPCTPKPAAPPEAVVIDKAEFGLAAQSVGGHRALVPSWLFQVSPGGGNLPYTLTRPAVSPEFLSPALPPHQEMPGGPSPVGPGKSAGDTPGKQVMSYSAEGTKLTVRFWGGVCGTYTARADESGTAVKVEVVKPVQDPGTVCVAMAKEQTASVTLEHPLGGRQVVNGTTGEKIGRG
ncbi:hypothetical protein HY68_19405 [Streptomyces sp. AcH 505]|uniref:hypothetical protein n=1 Tax=Streptomyces sp. AcH 505 TaxID=352211 RepID=UPI000591BCC0|nr:hypothetical protein HY68_19405 [Streptomyces sp. AcH 505]